MKTKDGCYPSSGTWRNSWRARRQKVWGKFIKGTLVALVAGVAMATDQAAMWLTWPGLVYGIVMMAVCGDALLTEMPY